MHGTINVKRYFNFHSELFWFRQQVLLKCRNKPSTVGCVKPHKTNTVRQDYRTEKKHESALLILRTRDVWHTSAFFFSACCLHSQGLSNSRIIT